MIQAKQLRTVVVREPFQKLCLEHGFKGYEYPIILNQFVYLATTFHTLDINKLINDTDLQQGWMPVGAAEMTHMIMTSSSRQMIQRIMNEIVSRGWLDKRTVAAGQKSQYRVNFEALERDLNDVGYSLKQLGYMFDMPEEKLPYPQAVITAVNAMQENHLGDDYDNSYDEFYAEYWTEFEERRRKEKANSGQKGGATPVAGGATVVAGGVQPQLQGVQPQLQGVQPQLQHKDYIENSIDLEKDLKDGMGTDAYADTASASIPFQLEDIVAEALQEREPSNKQPRKKSRIYAEADYENLPDNYRDADDDDTDDDGDGNYQRRKNPLLSMDEDDHFLMLAAIVTGRTSKEFHSAAEAKQWARATSPRRRKALEHFDWFVRKLLEQADYFKRQSITDKSKYPLSFTQFLSMVGSDAKYEEYLRKYYRDDSLKKAKENAEFDTAFWQSVEIYKSLPEDHEDKKAFLEELKESYRNHYGKELEI